MCKIHMFLKVPETETLGFLAMGAGEWHCRDVWEHGKFPP